MLSSDAARPEGETVMTIDGAELRDQWAASTAQVELEIEVREESFEVAGEPQPCWLARHPVTGVMAQGRTREEAIESLRQGVTGTFEVMREHGMSYDDAFFRVEAFISFVATRFPRGGALVAALPDPRTFHGRWRRMNDLSLPMTGTEMRIHECLCACPIEQSGIAHGPDCLLNAGSPS